MHFRAFVIAFGPVIKLFASFTADFSSRNPACKGLMLYTAVHWAHVCKLIDVTHFTSQTCLDFLTVRFERVPLYS